MTEGPMASGRLGTTRTSLVDEREALDRMFSAAYDELRRLAASVRRDEPGATLSPTALVNEAWLKLSASPHLAAVSALHFKRIAARAMRQVLIEAARRRTAQKRGGKRVAFVTFDDALDAADRRADEVLALDAALEELMLLHPRQGAVVEGRFFGGLEIPEIAVLLDVSEATVLRDWRAARAWLSHSLHAGR